MHRQRGVITLVAQSCAWRCWRAIESLVARGKVKNLPHMTWPEVRDLLTRTDMALIPVPALEQHGLHAPIRTDF